MTSCLPGGIATPWLIIIRITVCQPFAVYPAPTRLANVWQTVQVAGTISFPSPSGNSSGRAASAAQKRTAAIEDECNLLGIAISRARNRREPAHANSAMAGKSSAADARLGDPCEDRRPEARALRTATFVPVDTRIHPARAARAQ